MQGYNPMTPEQRRQDEWVAMNINKRKPLAGAVDWSAYKVAGSTVTYYASNPDKHFEPLP